MNPHKKNIPPVWADRLLTWVCSPDILEETQGDLHEAFHRRCNEMTPSRAKWYFVFDVLRSIPLGSLFLYRFFPKTSIAMLKNYLNIAYRNLLKHKAFSIINISGLAIGMAAFFIIVLYVRFELSYDRFHKNIDNLYRVTNYRFQGSSSTRMATNNPGAGPAMKAEIPEVVAYARAVHQGLFTGAITTWSHTDKAGNQKVFNEDMMYSVDPSFPSLFNFPFLIGEPTQALNDPKSVVISESVWHKFFGDESPIGETLTIDGERSFTVTGVFKDIPENSHIKFNVLTSFFLQQGWGRGWPHEIDWKWSEFDTYVLLDGKADPKVVEARLPQLMSKYNSDRMRELNYKEEMHLQPVSDIHLRSPNLANERHPHGTIWTVKFLMIIAGMILLIAWINYINLSTSKSLERAREVGIRKVAGASRSQLIIQFLFETALINIVAILLSSFLVVVFLTKFNYLIGKPLYESISIHDYWIWLGPSLVFVAGSLVAGFYPSFVLSSHRIMNVLKGQFMRSTSGVSLRSALVGFQFVIAVLLIAGTMLVFQQLSFMRDQDLGYNNEHLVILPAPRVGDSTVYRRTLTFANELLNSSRILGFTKTNDVPGKPLVQMNFLRREDQNVDENFLCDHLYIDTSFISTYGLKLVAGRNLRQDEGFVVLRDNDGEDRIHQLIINEKAADVLGFKSAADAVNKRVYFGQGSKQGWIGEIIGVIGNFHHQSLKDDYKPILFISFGKDRFVGQYFSLKIATGNPSETIAFIEQQYKKMFPGNQFNYFFLDDHYNRQYAADQQFGRIFGGFSALAVIVAGLGLFGLSSFVISKRSKEIAVRKVLGADFPSLVYLFSETFIKLVIIASIVALPIIYLVGQNWLNSFPFRISIGWIVVVAPTLVLLLISMIAVVFQTIKTSSLNPAKALKTD